MVELKAQFTRSMCNIFDVAVMTPFNHLVLLLIKFGCKPNAMRAGASARGQAAVTDALYFLLIVTGITIFLFGFANTYGSSVDAQIVKNYNVDFTTDSLKTILYSSVPRDPQYTLYDSSENIEIDHLLAYIKEDFSDDQALEPTTQKVLAQNIEGIMNPIANNFDYLFYIYAPNEKKFVFLFFHKANLVQEIPGKRDSPIIVPIDGPPYIDYFCAVKWPDSAQEVDYDLLRNEISQLTSNVGETSQSIAKIKLVKITGPTPTDVASQADLVIWNSTLLAKNTESGPVNFVFESAPWNCKTKEDLDLLIEQTSLQTS